MAGYTRPRDSGGVLDSSLIASERGIEWLQSAFSADKRCFQRRPLGNRLPIRLSYHHAPSQLAAGGVLPLEVYRASGRG